MALDSLVFLFGCAGVTFLIVHASIFDIPRSWLLRLGRFAEEMLACPFCTGFWVSLVISVLVSMPEVLGGDKVFPYILFLILIRGFAGAMAAYLFDKLAAGAEASETILAMVPAPDDDDADDEVHFPPED